VGQELLFAKVDGAVTATILRVEIPATMAWYVHLDRYLVLDDGALDATIQAAERSVIMGS